MTMLDRMDRNTRYTVLRERQLARFASPDRLNTMLECDSRLLSDLSIQRQIIDNLNNQVANMDENDIPQDVDVNVRELAVAALGNMDFQRILGQIPSMPLDCITSLVYGFTGSYPRTMPLVNLTDQSEPIASVSTTTNDTGSQNERVG